MTTAPLEPALLLFWAVVWVWPAPLFPAAPLPLPSPELLLLLAGLVSVRPATQVGTEMSRARIWQSQVAEQVPNSDRKA